MDKDDVLEYVADMAAQLSALSREHLPVISELLAFIAVIVQREVGK